MKKDALISKKVKAVIASAMAMTLAVPSVVMLSGTTPVQAEVELPAAIAVYNFDGAATEDITMVENSVKPVIGASEGRNGSVLTLNDTVVTPEVVKITTSAGVDANGNPIVNKTTTVIKEAEYSYSEAKVANPFKGMTELDESPSFPNDKNPYWEKGVTISYWQKATDTDSSVISFSNSRENVVHKDDRDKYNLFKLYQENPDSSLFALGEAQEINFTTNMKWTDGKKIKAGDGVVTGNTYTVLVGCGPFVKFNPNYQGGCYYLEPKVVKDTIREYTLHSIDMHSDTKTGPINMEDYIDPTSPTTLAKSGTTEGGLQFNASGAWGYVECGAVAVYQGSELFDSAMSLSQGNHAVAHAYINGTDASGQSVVVYQPEALVNKADEWHYITRVIKNDSISTYVDGVLKDREIYTDRSNAGTVDTNKGFNCGWGYYTSSSETDDPIIVQKWKTSIFENTKSITIAPKGSYEMRTYSDEILLGFNGNTNGMTILEMLIDENTTLSFGGQSLGMKDAFTYVTETQAGTAIDNVAFFAEPLTNDQVAALYAKAQESDIKGPETPVEPSPEPSEPVTGAPVSPEPSTPAEPSPEPSTPVTGAPVSPEPSEPSEPVDVMLGDVDGNKVVELADAQMALRAALKIIKLDAKQTAAADVDGNKVVELEDAQQILKYALKIINKFE